MSTKNLLLVEGRDDEHVLKHLLGNTNRCSIWDIRASGSVESLVEELGVAPKASGYSAIAAVADADLDPAVRWQQLRGALSRAGYTGLPTRMPVSGLVHPREGYLPKVGLWMMPDNRLGGMLEDFLSVLIDPKDALWNLASDVTDFVIREDRRFAVSHAPKAKLYTWLAWQETPGTPFGRAITKKYFSVNASAATDVLSWLDLVSS